MNKKRSCLLSSKAMEAIAILIILNLSNQIVRVNKNQLEFIVYQKGILCRPFGRWGISRGKRLSKRTSWVCSVWGEKRSLKDMEIY